MLVSFASTKLFSTYQVNQEIPSSWVLDSRLDSARAGTFRNQFTTPALVTPAIGGAIPHLTKDLLEDHTNRTLFMSIPYADVQGFAGLGKNIRECLSIDDNVFTIVTRKSAFETRPDPKLCIEEALLNNFVYNVECELKPDLWVCPYDPVPESVGSNRNSLAIHRTANWNSMFSGSRKVSAIVGKDAKSVEISLRTATDPCVKPAGYFVDVGSRFVEITVAKYLPSELPRIVSASVSSPLRILELIAEGYDLVETSYPYFLAKSGFASSFSLADMENVTALTSDMSFDVRSKLLLLNQDPLVRGCYCFTCRNHSAAYVRHLIETHEMLGETLLFAHNLFMLLRLVDTARKKIIDGSFLNWFEQWKKQNDV